jgi:hypothetical protein
MSILPSADWNNHGVRFSQPPGDSFARMPNGDGGDRRREMRVAAGADPVENCRRLQNAVDKAVREGGGVITAMPGIYRGNLRIPEGAQNIVLRGVQQEGRRAVFDMSGAGTSDSRSSVFEIKGGRNIAIENFEIRNYRGSSQESPPSAIKVTGASSNIRIANNEIHNFGSNSRDDRIGSQPILVQSQSAAMRNITIEGNYIHDVGLNRNEAIAVNGNVDGFKISSNRIFRTNNIAIDAIGGEEGRGANNRARNGVIANNWVRDVNTDRNSGYHSGDRSAAGIYIDGAQRIQVANNLVEGCHYGIEVGTEHRGFDADSIRVTGNILRNNNQAALKFGPGDGGGSTGWVRNLSYGGNIFQGNKQNIDSEQNHVDRGSLRADGGDRTITDPHWQPPPAFMAHLAAGAFPRQSGQPGRIAEPYRPGTQYPMQPEPYGLRQNPYQMQPHPYRVSQDPYQHPANRYQPIPPQAPQGQFVIPPYPYPRQVNAYRNGPTRYQQPGGWTLDDRGRMPPDRRGWMA